MNMGCVERQLVLNRLGETSLNYDTVEIIKGFAFKSPIQVYAEQQKKLLNKQFKFVDRNNYDCWPKWSVQIHNFDPKKVKLPHNIEWREEHRRTQHRGCVVIKQIGAIMCGWCGNYRAWLSNLEHPSRDEAWVPYRVMGECASRARCSCGMGDFWESDVDIVDNEVHTWPPREGSSAYSQLYEY